MLKSHVYLHTMFENILNDSTRSAKNSVKSCVVLWLFSSMADHFAFCFLSFHIVVLFGTASGDKDGISREQSWFKPPSLQSSFLHYENIPV